MLSFDPFGQRTTLNLSSSSLTMKPPSSCPPVTPGLESVHACCNAERTFWLDRMALGVSDIDELSHLPHRQNPVMPPPSPKGPGGGGMGGGRPDMFPLTGTCPRGAG